jgi:hypothetical protein
MEIPMDQPDHAGDMVLRAAFQIACGTGDRVEYEMMNNVVPLTRDELTPIIASLASRGFAQRTTGDGAIALTPSGIEYAAKLPPMSEPPLMADA